MGRVRIPPDDVAILLPVDDCIVVARLALVGTPRLRLTGLQVLPVDGRARQVPAAREIGFPERLDASLVSRVGDDDAVNLDSHLASRRENIDPVEWVLRVVQHGRLLLVPCIEGLEFNLDEPREFRVERVRHQQRRDRLVTHAQGRGRRLNPGDGLVVRETRGGEKVGFWDPVVREELVLPDQLRAGRVEDPFPIQQAPDSLVRGHDLRAEFLLCVKELRGEIGEARGRRRISKARRDQNGGFLLRHLP